MPTSTPTPNAVEVWCVRVGVRDLYRVRVPSFESRKGQKIARIQDIPALRASAINIRSLESIDEGKAHLPRNRHLCLDCLSPIYANERITAVGASCVGICDIGIDII
jgi:hypothetical protein